MPDVNGFLTPEEQMAIAQNRMVQIKQMQFFGFGAEKFRDGVRDALSKGHTTTDAIAKGLDAFFDYGVKGMKKGVTRQTKIQSFGTNLRPSDKKQIEEIMARRKARLAAEAAQPKPKSTDGEMSKEWNKAKGGHKGVVRKILHGDPLV